MKKVTYIADLGSDQRTGGGQTFARELLDILEKLPIELTALIARCPRIDGQATPRAAQHIKYLNLPWPGISDLEMAVPWTLKLRSYLTRMPKQDLYFFDQPATWTSLLPKAPLVAMFHGADRATLKNISVLHPRQAIRKLLWGIPVLNGIQKQILKKRNGIPLFNSRYTLLRLSKEFEFDPEPLEGYVTYLPVDVEKYQHSVELRRQKRAQLGISENETVILYLSNFSPPKQPEKVPPIVAQVLSAVPQKTIRFLFVGRNIVSKPIDDLINDPVTKERCIRVPEVSHDEIGSFYSSADIAMFTGNRDTFGYYIVEGMAAGLPFVAYQGGAITEIQEDQKTGFIVDSEEAFVKALLRLIENNGLRRTMGEAGLQRAEKLFSKKAFQLRLVNILTNEFDLFSG